jgi:zinc-binding alcohol dehydrogenase family protein
MRSTMRAIVHSVYGAPEVLAFVDLPKPVPGPRDLLVRVHAVSVNPVDAKQRQTGAAGTPVPNAPRILGWDAAGVVEATGAEVKRFRASDAVYFAGDIGRPGSYAEFVAVDERIVARKPGTLSFENAAAVPLTALTAWEGILETFRVAPGEGAGRPLLIIGGAGGVGSFAIPIAKRICGFKVIATASRPESRARCTALGADAVIDHGQALAPQLAALGLPGVDYIFSTATLDNFAQMVEALNPLGHVCVIQSGPAARSVDLNPLMPKRGTLSYELMFTRPRTGAAPEKQGEILAQVARLIDDGTLAGTATEILSWREVQEAHRRIETAHTLGKIVLRID